MREGQSPADGEIVEPAPAAAVAPLYPLLPTNAFFYLAFHPARWTVDIRHGLLLPDVVKIAVEPGLNGVRYRDGRPPDETPALRMWRESGWEVLPHSAGPNGQSYVRRTRVAGGWYFRLPWEIVYQESDQVDFDAKGFKAWIDGLVEKEAIKAPSLVHLRAEAVRLQREADRSASAAKVSVGHERQAAALAAAVETLRAYIESRSRRSAADGEPVDAAAALAPEEPPAPPPAVSPDAAAHPSAADAPVAPTGPTEHRPKGKLK